MAEHPTIIPIPEIAGVATARYDLGTTTLSQGGYSTEVCRIPWGWDDEKYRGGFALNVQGYHSYWNSPGNYHFGARTSDIYVHKNPGSRPDALGSRWTRLERLYRVAPYTNFSQSPIGTALFGQCAGKYLYRAFYTRRGDAWAGPNIHIARLSGNQNLTWVVNKWVPFNDFHTYEPPFFLTTPTDGYVTDHTVPWIWYQYGSTVLAFRDDNGMLGYSYNRVYWDWSRPADIPAHIKNLVGRVWAFHQDYAVDGNDDRYLYPYPVLVQPWSNDLYSAPELWWFVKQQKQDGSFTGVVEIYRAKWMEHQFLRYGAPDPNAQAQPGSVWPPYPFATARYSMSRADVGWSTGDNDEWPIEAAAEQEFLDYMRQLNPTYVAFDREWHKEENLVGTILPGSWAPGGIGGVGILSENPTRIRIRRNPIRRDALTMVFYFPNRGSYNNWTGYITFFSNDDGKTWGRPTLTQEDPELRGYSISRPVNTNWAPLDNGHPIAPVTLNIDDDNIAVVGGTANTVALMYPTALPNGMGFVDGRDVIYRRSDINREAWV